MLQNGTNDVIQMSLLDPQPWLEGSYELGSAFLPSFRPEVFLRLAHKFFLKLSMVLEANVVLCVTELDFSEKIILPQNGENGPKIGKFSQ